MAPDVDTSLNFMELVQKTQTALETWKPRTQSEGEERVWRSWHNTLCRCLPAVCEEPDLMPQFVAWLESLPDLAQQYLAVLQQLEHRLETKEGPQEFTPDEVQHIKWLETIRIAGENYFTNITYM